MEALKETKLSYIIEAAITIVIGLVLVVWTGDSIRLVARILAALLILVGGIAVARYFLKKTRTITSSAEFVIGIIIAAVGLWIFLNPDTFTDFIPKLFGIFILISGLGNLGQMISLVRYKSRAWWVSLIIALVTVGLGAFLLFNPTGAKEIAVTMIGIFLMVDGGTNLVNSLIVGKAAKRVEQEKNAIDVEAVVVEEKK
ncbi:HdeD family acid-resistance protein [Butyrivibrio sp. YAB3001]|uniref:HdeD family acid-resistance protein n=1 Tax=Butyrivibrio sp. YAB3001 TaxID=1520812 RepID=UPI0008F66D60|nr:DUF308 domain-containing protein [Butyrivibrio sp. YAB3001]SFB84894.1 Uncharacterized membrane protein HdeD, DUF308 family [Butyrivibrio sp. YAB3001]